MLMVMDITSLPSPSLPRNSEKLVASVVDPEDHSSATADDAPSKSSSNNTTTGTHEIVGDAVVGLADGLPGVTVGPAVVGAPVVGLAVLGAAVVGVADGLPGVTVGPAVVGAPVVGLAVVGVADGLPGVTVGDPVSGDATGLVVGAQS